MSDATRHVDLVANRWSLNVQQRVCVVSADGSVHRTVYASERLDYETVVADALDAHPERTALDAVFRDVQGTYLFATGPHELDDCPFLSTDEIPMTKQPAGGER